MNDCLIVQALPLFSTAKKDFWSMLLWGDSKEIFRCQEETTETISFYIYCTMQISKVDIKEKCAEQQQHCMNNS